VIKGFVTFVLHTHLPWVLGHGRWPHGTDWLNEAAAECYIPILNQLFTLRDQGYSPQLSIGITPILQEQLGSPDFVREFEYYLGHKIEAAEDDIQEFSKRGQKEFLSISQMWKTYYLQLRENFQNKFQKNLLQAFNQLQQQGLIEIITSAATHGYLPLVKYDRSVGAQIQLGVEVYKKNFGQAPHGIWLPECAYRPAYKWTPPVGDRSKSYHRKSIDEFLSKQGIEYFIVDAHLLKGGKAIGVYLSRFKALKSLWQHFKKEFIEVKEDFPKSPQEIYLVSSNPHIKPVAILTRDPASALQVWSGDLGYPGESQYLDFHKKRFPGGLRYWRVTDSKIDLALKEIYNPDSVEEKIKEHANHFVSLIKKTARDYYEVNKRPAIICTPFDTELFGHWWFEGPRWIYHVLKLIEEDNEIKSAAGTLTLKQFEPDRIVSLPEGSWGEGGFHYIWLNKLTEWTWERIYEAEDIFYTLYDTFSRSRDEKILRFLQQLGRELLLLQSSDWQFLISTWSARDYAELRFSRHFDNFRQIARILTSNKIGDSEINILRAIEEQDCCFKDLDLSVFQE
jgi:1,4-alpha-glucan branching enzyme